MRPPMHRDAEPRNPCASKLTFYQTQPTVVPALASLFEEHEDILTPMQSIPYLTGSAHVPLTTADGCRADDSSRGVATRYNGSSVGTQAFWY